MKTSKIIEGMQILNTYYYQEDGYNTGAEHDYIYMCITDKPVSVPDLKRLIELGWEQPYADWEDEDSFTVSDYDPGEGWRCRT